MNISATFINRPVATTLLTIGIGARRGDCLSFAPGVAPSSRRLSDDPGIGESARSGPRDHGHIGRGAP